MRRFSPKRAFCLRPPPSPRPLFMPRSAFWSAAPAALLCFHTDARGRAREIYGESESRAVFSAGFPACSRAGDRAFAGRNCGSSALRGAAAYRMLPSDLNGKSPQCPHRHWLLRQRSAGAAPRATKFANLLPAERRASHNRLQYVIPGSWVLLVASLVAAFLVIFPPWNKSAIARISIARPRQLEPAVLRTQTLEKSQFGPAQDRGAG